MVKSLHDICLSCIRTQLGCIPQIGNLLPTTHKEMLLELIVNHDDLTQANLKHVQKNLFVDSLRHVVFYKCDQVTDDVLKCMGGRCRKLVTLEVKGCHQVSDTGIRCILERQKNLELLKLKNLPLFTGKGFDRLKCQQLKTLNCTNCQSLTVQGLSLALNNNPNISELVLMGSNKLDKTVFSLVARTLRHNLEEFSGCPHPVGDSDLMELAKHCPNLKKLSLLGCSKMSGQVILELSQGCTKLTQLDLSYCYKLKDDPDNQSLWTLPTLITELSLCGIMVSDEQLLIECLQRLKHLKNVRLCGIPALNDNTLPQILQHIGNSLEVLDLSSSRSLSDDGLKAVTKYCTSLRELDLSMCPTLTCNTLVPLFQDPERAQLITKLFVCCRMMDVDFLNTVISCCKNMEKLDMAGLKCVTDDILCTLAANSPCLRHLGVKGCSEITDTGLCEIARCCSLRSLVISGIHNITDKSIFTVANNCHYLEEIYLNGCSRVSPTTMVYLKDCCIPRLYIQHKTPNIVGDHLMAKNLDTGEFCRMDQHLE